MLKKLVASLTILAVATIALAATELHHNPKKSHAANHVTVAASQVNEQPKIDARGTADQPLMVTSPKDEQKEADDHALTVWTRYLGMGTFALVLIAILQALLFWRQLHLMVAGSKDARIVAMAAMESANAAKKSADVAERSLTQLERPHVYGGVRKAGYEVHRGDGGGTIERSDLELVIYNFGRTPARLTHIEYQISLSPRGGIPDPIDHTKVAGSPLPVGTMSANLDPFVETTNCRLTYVAEEEDLLSNQQSIWIAGFVRYADFFGNHHVTGFAQVLDLWSARFIRRGDNRYNYSLDETESDIPPQPAAEGGAQPA